MKASRIKPVMRTLRTGLVFALASCAMASWAEEEEIMFNGICDASAAVALGPDTFVVADDEKSDALLVYKTSGGPPIGKRDLPKELVEDDGEADLEGAARVGSDTYWISSHGSHTKPKKAKARRQFFATDASFKPVGKSYRDLVDQFLKQSWAKDYKLEEAIKKDPEEDGLNIEGLAAWGGGVLIGLRSPLKEDRMAIAIPLENPLEVVKGIAPPRLGKPLEFDLEGLGIRSMEKVGEVYWIVGGPKGKEKGKDKNKNKTADKGSAFKLFSWSGRRDDQPKLNRDLPEGLNFEALFEMNGRLWALADDGEVKKNSTECKKLTEMERQFRGLSIEPKPITKKP